MINLNGTPYVLDQKSEVQITNKIKEIEERMLLLRKKGSLSEETIKNYYGEKRFEQVAESNAIEGSTLSAGETELAVVKGITVTGHNPIFVRDALSLDKALQRLFEMAKEKDKPLDIEQLHELHGIILGDRKGGGIFRNEPVRIKGADHVPPETWKEVMDRMELWEKWSKANSGLATPIRAVVLHAWLTHIHPFIDGNGRTARAIVNLELIRSGYPPIIIKKKERDRYRESLAESDSGGDIRSFFELILEKIEGSLVGLELSAKKVQGYDPVLEKIKQKQEQHLQILQTSVQLLINMTESYLDDYLEKAGGHKFIKIFESPLDLDTYRTLCEKIYIPNSWAFIVNIEISGFNKLEKLAYFGYRTSMMYRHMNNTGAPSLYWSSKNPLGYPKWITDDENAPYCIEMTTKQGVGDTWVIRKHNDEFETLSISELAQNLARSFIDLATKNS